MSTFINVTGTPLYYLEEMGQDGFVGFYATDDTASPELAFNESWNCAVGYYVFVRSVPGPVDPLEYWNIASAIGALLEGDVARYTNDHSSFLWLEYYGDGVVDVACIRTTAPAEPPPEEEEDPPGEDDPPGEEDPPGEDDPPGEEDPPGGDDPYAAVAPYAEEEPDEEEDPDDDEDPGDEDDPAEDDPAEDEDPPYDDPEECDPSEDVEPVTVVAEATIDFGGYRIPVHVGMIVSYTEVAGSPASIIRFTFVQPATPEPACPPVPAVPSPDGNGLHLWLGGPRAGTLEGIGLIGDLYSTACTSWNVGLRYVARIDGADVHQFYPVFDIRDRRMPLFTMRWHPLAQLDPERSHLEFWGTSVVMIDCGDCPRGIMVPPDPDLLRTHFRTVTGEVVAFSPVVQGARRARLVFEVLRTTAGRSCYYLVPSGEFVLTLIDGATGAVLNFAAGQSELPARFLCGLAGVESVAFEPRRPGVAGDRIAFFPGKPAYAPEYPIVSSSPQISLTWDNDVFYDIDLRLLSDRYRTAWTSFVAGAGGNALYYAQPENAPLYAPATGPILALFEPAGTVLSLPDVDHCFPIAPAAGAAPGSIPAHVRPGFLMRFETEILGPHRRETIRTQVRPGDATPPTPAGLPSGVAATTQGLVATVAGMSWTNLIVARNGAGTSVTFGALNPTLKSAIQSNGLFLVATRPRFLGVDTPFEAVVRMGDWTFNIDLAQNGFGRLAPGPGDGDFRDLNNTLIFKFSPGSILDRIRKPKSWTNAGSFNEYGCEALATLATRLAAFVGYSERRQNDHPAYRRFMSIVRDPNWTGVLAINVDVGRNMPPELQALTAGVNYDLFVAHHIVVESSSFDYGGIPPLPRPGDCSTFGLIDYVKPRPVGADPSVSNAFNFAVTDFRVWFDNGALREFACSADLSINMLFDETVRQVGGGSSSASSSIRMAGVRETRGGRPAYTFNLEGSRTFELNSKVIESVQIRKAEFAAISQQTQGIAGTTMRCTFSFHGTIRFRILTGTDRLVGGVATFDALSYEPLAFEGLALDMTFQLNPPNPPGQPDFAFTTARMAFDQAPGSTVLRSRSLVKKFPMKLQTFHRVVSGQLPGAQGFVPVLSPLVTQPLKSEIWYGFEYELNLGTLGELAANAGLVTRLLVAWSPGSDQTRAGIWMKFPGATGFDLFSLQGVVRFGARAYELRQYPTQTDTGYVLMLDNFALRVLGISIPSGGGPNIFVFGNPNPAGPEDDKLGWIGVYSK